MTDELAAASLLVWSSDAEEKEYEERLGQRWGHYLEHDDGEYIYDVSALLRPSSGAASSAECKTLIPRNSEEQTKGLDISMRWPHEERFTYPQSDVSSQTIQVERTLIGSGQERTLLQVVLTNTDDRLAQRVLWYETLGYFVKPFLHTLKHEIAFLPLANATSTEDELLRTIADFESPIESLTYQPTNAGGKEKRKPFVLESVVRLPARSKVTLTMELRKTFVPYSQHPPDAHRGFDLAPAIIFPLAAVDPREALLRQSLRKSGGSGRGAIGGGSRSTSDSPVNRIKAWLLSKQQREENRVQAQKYQASLAESRAKVTTSTTQTRIYTLPRLVELATPDFSFVYTNIIFTSTVVALFFGSTLNTLLRTYTDFVI